jgi:ATP-binding cassette subfamily A (ABC1) protein 3
MIRAVDDLSISLYRDQIFVLLGHNGAGKTTTLEMLVSLNFAYPTDGQAHAFGLNLFTQKDLVRKLIGVCPQKNLLIMNMTVFENLQFFLGIRMMSDDEIEKYAEKMLSIVDLKKKRDELVSDLSGG